MTRLPELFLSRPIAHRALHDIADGRPENSRAAIRAAIAHGYGIEIDLQLSQDGQAMVFHDYALARLTGQDGTVQQRSVDDLRAIPLKGGDETIPDLPEVLDLIAGQVPLLIELKDQDGAMGPGGGTLERATTVALEGYAGPVAVMSFNPHSVTEMARLLPDVPRGLVTCAYRYEDWPLPRQTCDRLREIPDYEAAGASFISHDWRDLDRQRLHDLAQAGADILCWTIRSAAEETQARRVAQNITFEGYLPS